MSSAPTIVVVEDDLDLRSIYTELLNHGGCEAIGFSDGQSALQALQKAEVKPDLILLDVMLPGEMNGERFLQRLAEQPNVEPVPVVLVSALAAEDHQIAQARRHPWVVAFFNKAQVTNNKLADLVKGYLREKSK